MKTIPFTIAPKIIRYLGINLTKEVKDLYSENCKTLVKETKDDIKTWKEGRLLTTGWLSCLVSAFGSGHDPRDLGSSPASGSPLSGKPAFPSPTPPACVPSLAVSLSNK